MKLPEPTAEERSSKLSFIYLCHVSVQCNKGKLNVLKCLFMFSIFLCSNKTGKALTNFSNAVRYAVLFFIRDLAFSFGFQRKAESIGQNLARLKTSFSFSVQGVL